MKYQPGDSFQGTIIKTRLRSIAGKPCAEITVEDDQGTEVKPVVFMTESSAKIASVQLRQCGFDTDETDIGELEESPEALSGNTVWIEVEEYNNRIQYRIMIPDKLSKKAISGLRSQFRGREKLEKQEAAAKDVDDIPF